MKRWVACAVVLVVGALVLTQMSSPFDQTHTYLQHYAAATMNPVACGAIKLNEPQSVVEQMYGRSDQGAPDGDGVSVSWDGGADFYAMGQRQECDVYYREGKVYSVYMELLP
jgi:hypothetical protein